MRACLNLIIFASLIDVSRCRVAMDIIAEANLKNKLNFPDGVAIYDSDIKIQYDSKISKVPKKSFNAGLKDTGRLWPGAVIPYTMTRSLQRLENAKRTIKQAMAEWETNTCIRFVERTNEVDYVEFAVSLGCNADVGRRGDKQIISLGDGCLHKSVVVHEIGHVIGFWHEQNRPDRDNHVTIFTDNIMDPYKEAFAKYDRYRINSLDVEYDYYSIMHYGNKAFSKNNKETIKPKKAGIGKLGNDQLSPLDIKQTMLLYKCDELNRTWTSWSVWTNCDKTCAGGTQERTRVCTRLNDGKQECPGEKLERRVCNMKKCPDWPKFPQDFSFEHLRVDRNKEIECVLVYERKDYQEWNSYSFCNKGKRSIHMLWSDRGPIPTMKCIQIFEPKERASNRWYDNYLCIPYSAPYNLTWSFNGKIDDQACLQWYAKEGRDGWDDNYLCAAGSGLPKPVSRPQPIDGGWSLWSNFSLCTKECGRGKQRRLRLCSNPAPKFGGNACIGSGYEDRDCNTAPCRKSTCGGVLKGTKGEFFSPNYPSNYPSNTNCTWIIEGNNKKDIILTIKSFDFEKIFEEPCQFDYLLIKDMNSNGQELGKFCGNHIPLPIISTGKSLWVNMVTDGDANRAGFRASWKLVEAEKEGCGGIIRGRKGKLSSPNFPKQYPPDRTCKWMIEVPKGHFIQMKFVRFDLEMHSICRYDSVEVKDGWSRTSPHLGRYCGLNPIRGTLKTRTNRVWIKFISDHSREKSGFKLSWRAFKQKEKNSVVTDKQTGRVCPDGWSYYSRNIEGGACYKVKRNYFNWYGARDDCLSNEADLVSITTRSEQDFVTLDLLRGTYMWLGMTDEVSEGRWSWSDNTTATSFNNWDRGDPNNGGRLQNEDCALIKPDGKWNDYPCVDRFNYICKKKPFETWNLGISNKPSG